MAKVGNEAKLILSLAKERMKEQVALLKYSHESTLNYEAGVKDYETILGRVVAELEAGK